LRNTLDVIKTVNTDDELDILELFLEGCDAFDDLRLFEAFIELFGVDADRERANSNDLTLEFDCVRGSRQSSANSLADVHMSEVAALLQDSGTTAQEMTRVVVSVEADQIAVQNSIQDLIANGQDAINLARRERCV